MLPHITRLALETACRLGELFNLEWEHINFRHHTLVIPHTKTDVPRTIPLGPDAIKALKGISRPEAVDVFVDRVDQRGHASEYAVSQAFGGDTWYKRLTMFNRD